MKNNGLVIGGAVAGILLVALVAFWMRSGSGPGTVRKSPELAAASQLQTQMMEQMRDPNVSQEQRQQTGQQFFEEMQKLTPEQQEQFVVENQQEMERQMIAMQEQQLNEVLAMSEAEQMAELDRRSAGVEAEASG